MDWTLELVVVPVSDIDRAKAFYSETLDFTVDVDFSPNEDFRVVQLTPPGSACSITLIKNPPMAPGSLHGAHFVVKDIDAALAKLTEGGVDVSGPFHFGPEGQTSGHHPERENYGTFLSFRDPDGNSWLVQEVDRSKQPGA